jgi:hypothetical protein
MPDEVELEAEWGPEKAARQAAASQLPSRKSRKGLLVALVAMVIAGAMVAVVIYAGDKAPSGARTSGPVDQIKIEMRAIPSAEIRIDGRKVGTTPISLSYPRSAKQIVVEARMIRHLVKRGAERNDVYKDVRTITLDRDQLLDFRLATATLTEQGD